LGRPKVENMVGTHAMTQMWRMMEEEKGTHGLLKLKN
jgi:hypothetical protein